MKTFVLFFILSTCFILSSQSNLSIFNNSGQRFYVILNGVKQNSLAQTNVSVSDVRNGGYSVKLIFEDGITPDIDKNFFIDSPSDITTKVVFKKGKGKLQLVSIFPTSGAIQSNSVIYRPNDSSIYSDQQIVQTNQNAVSQVNGTTGSIQSTNTVSNLNSENSNITQNSTMNIPTSNDQVNVSSSSAVTNSSSTVTVGSSPQNIQLSFGVNTNGLDGGSTEFLNGNINLGLTVNGHLNSGINEIQTTQTSITQSHAETLTTNLNTTNHNTIATNVLSDANQNSMNTPSNSNSNNSINNSNANCIKTISDFDEFMNDLKSQTFEDDKIETIKKDLVSSCVYHQQALKIIETLKFEENRFDIAKFLFPRTLDRKLSEKGILPLFTFESTKVDWRDFVRNFK